MAEGPEFTSEPIWSTIPSTEGGSRPHLIVEPAWTDPRSGAVFVHRDLELARDAWEDEAHVSPMNRSEAFGDVESWVAFVQRYGEPSTTLLTWNERGLLATLDYAASALTPGRAQWKALCPFTLSRELAEWQMFANGRPHQQRAAIEKLEELAEDITDPDASTLMTLLRALRANVSSQANTELRADGTTNVLFSSDRTIKTGAQSADLPPVITITIPLLAGHVNVEGKVVKYALPVRVRAAVDDQAHLGLRFTLMSVERALEDLFAERVQDAKYLLGETYLLLRAAPV